MVFSRKVSNGGMTTFSSNMHGVYQMGLNPTGSQSSDYNYEIGGPVSNRTTTNFKILREQSKQSIRNQNIILEDDREINYSSSNHSTRRSLNGGGDDNHNHNQSIEKSKSPDESMIRSNRITIS